LLEALARAPVEELTARAQPLFAYLETGGLHPIWFSPRVLMIPLRCQGLPPSTHTNAFLVGTDSLYLLDPGPVDPAEQQRLLALLDSEWRGHGGRFEGVILTHHHPDHIGAATACARHLGVPILAHPLTAEALCGRVEVTRFLNEGDCVDLGAAPHGGGRWQLQALHTPGHAAGHLTFWEPSYRLLFAGDMVSTLSSIVIAPPDGDLAQYLASLQRLQQYPARLLLPAHGPPSARAAQVLEAALANRRTREEQLLAALRAEPRPLAELTTELYRGLPANMMKFAQMQTLAGLRKLQHEGRAEAVGETDWRGRTSSLAGPGQPAQG
jgi:glyoxylase-like metal-dependent hydrolase (beta-lactamase superfamily II)